MKSCVSRLSLLLGVVSVIATMLMVQSCGGSEQSGPASPTEDVRPSDIASVVSLTLR
jgi:hypothetical protein